LLIAPKLVGAMQERASFIERQSSSSADKIAIQ
jgi:hypothetical protein